MFQLLIIGGGFAGVWSAISAMRLCKNQQQESNITITLISNNPYHGIRPRYYESDLQQTQILLENILNPIGVKHITGNVCAVDLDNQKVAIKCTDQKTHTVSYDRLILAVGSQLFLPPIPGLEQYSFNIDTYSAAIKLNQHLQSLPNLTNKGLCTIVVAGGGFTGLEIAT